MEGEVVYISEEEGDEAVKAVGKEAAGDQRLGNERGEAKGRNGEEDQSFSSKVPVQEYPAARAENPCSCSCLIRDRCPDGIFFTLSPFFHVQPNNLIIYGFLVLFGGSNCSAQKT